MKKFLIDLFAPLAAALERYMTRTGLILWDSGGESQQAAPTTQTINNVTIPEYAKPYAENLLGQSAALTDINQNPYQPFAGQQVAPFNPLQVQAFNQIGNMQPSLQNNAASDMAYGAGIGALQAGNYQPGQFRANHQPGQFSSGYTSPQFNSMGIGYERTGTGTFTDPGVAASYMNPYMKNVVDFQTQEATRAYRNTLPAEQALAVSKGAFGGNRQALNQSEMQRNLNTQLGGIAATGAANAYQQAQQAFMADQARSLASQQGNQQAGLAAQGQGLQQSLAGNQHNLANAQNASQFGLQAQQMGEQSRQYGAGLDMQAQQLGEQSRQYGAGLGLQGLQTGLQAAGQLGALGQQDYTQRMGIGQAQLQAGALQQQNTQQQLNADYQKYADQMNYPYKQLGFMQGIVQGLPISQTSQQMFQAPPTTTSSLASLGLGAYGLSGLLGKKEGGVVKMAGGGLADQFQMMSTADNLPDQALMKSQAVPGYMKQGIMQQRGMLRTAMPPTPQQEAGIVGLNAPNMEFADGGIVGYAGGGDTKYDYADYYGRRRPDGVGFNEVAPGMGILEKLRAAFGIDSTPIDPSDMSLGAKLRAVAGVPVAGSALPMDVVSSQNPGAAYGPAATPFEGEYASYNPVQQATPPAANGAPAAPPPQQSTHPAVRSSGIATATPAPVMQRRSLTLDAPEGIDALMSQFRKAQGDAEKDNPLYEDAKKLKARADAADERRESYGEKTPYLMALQAAAELGKAGQPGGTMSAIARSLGISGAEYAKREEQMERMAEKADEGQMKMLGIKAGLRKEDATRAEKLMEARLAQQGRYDTNRVGIHAADTQYDSQRHSDASRERVGMAQVAATREGIAQRAAMANNMSKIDTALLGYRNSAVKNAERMLALAAKDPMNSLNAEVTGKTPEQLALMAHTLANNQLANDGHYQALLKQRGITALVASDTSGLIPDEAAGTAPVRAR